LGWIIDNQIVSKDDLPTWFATLFSLNCFIACGYLVFSLWFALHCSIITQSLGTRMLINFARLSLPDKETIKRLRVHFYDAGLSALTELPGLGGRHKDHGTKPQGSQASSSSTGPPQAQSSIDTGRKDDSDIDFERHLRLWLCESKQWISYEAYSRACMIIGMNETLQALTYNIMANVWDASPVCTSVSVVAAKLLSYHCLQIDVGVIRDCGRHMQILFVLEILPPMLALCVLYWIQFGGRRCDPWMTFSGCLVFVLHAGWMLYVARLLREGKHELARHAEKLVDSESDGSSEESTADVESGYHRSQPDLEKRFPVVVTPISVIHLEQPELGKAQGQDTLSAPVQNLPARIVRRFTLWMAVCYIASGVVYALSVEYEKEVGSRNSTSPDGDVPTLAAGRQLNVEWPEPSSLFEVSSLQCLGGRVLIRDAFATYVAERRGDARLGALRDLGAANVAAVLCQAHGCDALTSPPGAGPWLLGPLERCLGGSAGADAQEVPVPPSWRLAAQGASRAGTERPSASPRCGGTPRGRCARASGCSRVGAFAMPGLPRAELGEHPRATTTSGRCTWDRGAAT